MKEEGATFCEGKGIRVEGAVAPLFEPYFFGKIMRTYRDAYLNGCVLRREATVLHVLSMLEQQFLGQIPDLSEILCAPMLQHQRSL